jgi:hypothetical protein
MRWQITTVHSSCRSPLYIQFTLQCNFSNVRKINILAHIRVFHKKNSIQLECVSKTYIKDLMYLKRNTKFLPDRWGLKTPLASQSSLNEIVFRSLERSIKSLRKVDFSKNG